ncbi:MAG: FAD-dependent oxidoreductase [Mycobacteriales bacterium]
MSRERLVVIGGDAAGMSAAAQARRRRAVGDLQIVALERGRYTSYSACGIPYWIAGDVSAMDHLIARSPEEFGRADIDVRTGHEAIGVDTGAGEVTVRGPSGEQRVGYDQLMIATGARPIRPDLPGINTDGVYGVQTLSDGEAVQQALAAGPKRAVVVGAGYIGLELAEALVRRGLQVTVVEAAEQPMSTVDPDIGARIADVVRGIGIDLRLGEPVKAIEGEDRVRAVVTTGGTVPADMVVLGLGVAPETALAAAAGIACGASNGVATKATMESVSHHRVWSAGDCVESHHRVSHRGVNIALGTHANKQGRIAGTNIGGGYATFPGVVGTAVTKICELEIARTGLSSREATGIGLQIVTVSVDSTTRAGYFPGAQPITTKIIAERGTGRLLGAQIVGREGAAKRIDVLATALWNDMTVGELQNVDLSYAPPFAPTWDPVLIAARKAADAVGG